MTDEVLTCILMASKERSVSLYFIMHTIMNGNISTFAKLSLVLRTRSCLETDDVRGLATSVKCGRLTTKFVGCGVEKV